MWLLFDCVFIGPLCDTKKKKKHVTHKFSLSASDLQLYTMFHSLQISCTYSIFKLFSHPQWTHTEWYMNDLIESFLLIIFSANSVQKLQQREKCK